MAQTPIMNIKNVEIYMGHDFNYNKDNLCTICRENLSTPHENDFDAMISIGKCGSIFHQKCINKLQQTGFMSCPICTVKWEEQSVVKSSI